MGTYCMSSVHLSSVFLLFFLLGLLLLPFKNVETQIGQIDSLKKSKENIFGFRVSNFGLEMVKNCSKK